MVKKYFILISMILIVSMIVPLGSSFMPKCTHKTIHDQSMANPIDSDFYRVCQKFPSLCYSANILTDVSVTFYYTQRNKYSSTHSPSFCRSLIENADNERLLACAVGGCMHNPSDLVSHNKVGGNDGVTGTGMVPNAIRNSKIANNVIHVFAEQHLDNWCEGEFPFAETGASASLNDFEECRDLFKTAMLGEDSYSDMSEGEIDGLFDTFISEVQNSVTGYDASFKNKSFFVTIQSIPFVLLAGYIAVMLGFLLISVLLIFKVIKPQRKIRHFIGLFIFVILFGFMAFLFLGSLQGSAFDNFIKVIKPISNLVPIGDASSYIETSVSNTKELLSQGEVWLKDTEPSGFRALDEADSGVLLFDYIILFVLVGIFSWFIWFLFKRNKIKVDGTFGL